jgi:hypothetical protein
MGLDVTVAVVSAAEPEDRLERMFTSVARQSGGLRLEVLVAAPGPDAPTIERAAARAGVEVQIVPNPTGRRTAGLNRILERASGQILARVDARSRLPEDYLRRCVDRLERDRNVGIVGGVQLVEPPPSTVGQRALVARALANPLALGAPSYRRVGASGAVDTVYLGAFRTAELRRLGGFDEQLDANEDFDVAERVRRTGRTVWLECDLAVGYEPRASVSEVLRQYWAFGHSKGRYWSLGKGRPNRRQAVAVGGAVALVAIGLVRPRAAGAVVIAALVGVASSDPVPVDGGLGLGRRAGAAVLSVGLVGSWVAGVLVELIRTGWSRARHARDAS